MTDDPSGEDDTRKHSRRDEKEWFVEHMDSVARQTLLCNLSYDTMVELAPTSIDSPNQLARLLWSVGTDRILEEISGEVTLQ